MDEPKTLSELKNLFADNIEGEISAQDLRNFLVTTNYIAASDEIQLNTTEQIINLIEIPLEDFLCVDHCEMLHTENTNPDAATDIYTYELQQLREGAWETFYDGTNEIPNMQTKVISYTGTRNIGLFSQWGMSGTSIRVKISPCNNVGTFTGVFILRGYYLSRVN